MDFGDAFRALFTDPATNAAVQGVLVVGLIEFATGVIRAISNRSFSLDYVDVWVRSQLAGRIVPILLVLLGSRLGGDLTVGEFSLNLLATAGLAAAAAYVAAAAKSIVDSVNPSAPDEMPVE